MNAKTIAYWVTTTIVSCIMVVSGGLAVAHAPAMMKGLARLGYPAYFSNILGVAKLVGVCALLAPGYVLVKEWVYAGFGIVVLSAAYSHLQSGDGLVSLDPLVVFSLLVTSYLTRPASRRILFPPGPGIEPSLGRNAG